MLSAKIMSNILQAFATEADFGALNAKAAPDKPTTAAASVAWPAAAAPDKPTVAATGVPLPAAAAPDKRTAAAIRVALPAAAAPDKPTAAATGVALPAAAEPGEPQLNPEDRAKLTQRFNTDNLFRAEVIGCPTVALEEFGIHHENRRNLQQARKYASPDLVRGCLTRARE